MSKEEKDTQMREDARQRGVKREEEARERTEETRRREQEQKKRMEDVIRRRAKPALWLRYGPFLAYGIVSTLTFFLVFNSFSGSQRTLGQLYVNDDVHFTRHNEEKHSYTLGPNTFFEGVTISRVKDLTDNKLTTQQKINRCDTQPLGKVAIRDNFNFYVEQPQCRFDEVQKKCSGGYAELPLAVLRNRYCLNSSGRDFHPSADFVLACNRVGARGCSGGHVVSTVRMMQKGVVSDQCWRERIGTQQPKDCPASRLDDCERQSVGVHCLLTTEQDIKKEVQQNGPVVALMAVHRGFLSYRDGLFVPGESDRLPGFVPVKIVGWEGDRLTGGAWLVDPMWGRDWGRDGVGRVAFGVPDLMLEQSAYTLYLDKANKDQKEAGEKKKTE